MVAALDRREAVDELGLGGRVDWGIEPYAGAQNGGIVGTVTYDTTRNELDPQYAASEDWQPGVPNIPVRLYAPVECPGDPATPCDATDRFVVDTDGSLKKGKLLNSYLSEHWSPPSGCTARDVDGKPLDHPTDEDVLSPNQSADGECVAALVNGVAAVIFLALASVAWLPALLLAAGATAGGQLGARIGKRLSPGLLRVVIVVVGVAAIAQLVA